MIVLGGKYGIDWQKSKTINNYPLDVTRSALVKEIRRGKLDNAIYWGLELYKSGQEIHKYI